MIKLGSVNDYSPAQLVQLSHAERFLGHHKTSKKKRKAICTRNNNVKPRVPSTCNTQNTEHNKPKLSIRK